MQQRKKGKSFLTLFALERNGIASWVYVRIHKVRLPQELDIGGAAGAGAIPDRWGALIDQMSFGDGLGSSKRKVSASLFGRHGNSLRLDLNMCRTDRFSDTGTQIMDQLLNG